jgi:DNA-binding PadR family transcriptional regulator
MGRPETDYARVLESLIRDRFIEYDVDDRVDPPEGLYVLTAQGHKLLENWEFITDELRRQS